MSVESHLDFQPSRETLRCPKSGDYVYAIYSIFAEVERQVGRFLTIENLASICAHQAVLILKTAFVAHEVPAAANARYGLICNGLVRH
jgi:hypothetical protein